MLGDVPDGYRMFYFVNAGGPARKIVSSEVVLKKWQFVTLECGHRILIPKFKKTSKLGCGFCGGFDPLSAT